jgi:hypothetical protein
VKNKMDILQLVIAEVLIIGVGIPVTTTVIADNNLTGLTATIVGFVPVFMGIGAMVLAGSIAR